MPSEVSLCSVPTPRAYEYTAPFVDFFTLNKKLIQQLLILLAAKLKTSFLMKSILNIPADSCTTAALKAKAYGSPEWLSEGVFHHLEDLYFHQSLPDISIFLPLPGRQVLGDQSFVRIL